MEQVLRAIQHCPARLGVPYHPAGILPTINMRGRALAREMFFTAGPMGGQWARRAWIGAKAQGW